MSALPPFGLISATRSAVCNKIKELSFISDAMVVEHKSGNTQAKFNEALSKTQLAVIVGIESAKEGQGGDHRVDWKPVLISVVVFEPPIHQLLVPAPPDAWDYAEALVAELKYAALENAALPRISEEPLREIDAVTEGALAVRFSLEMNATGNSRPTP